VKVVSVKHSVGKRSDARVCCISRCVTRTPLQIPQPPGIASVTWKRFACIPFTTTRCVSCSNSWPPRCSRGTRSSENRGRPADNDKRRTRQARHKHHYRGDRKTQRVPRKQAPIRFENRRLC